ncbi:MAG: DUF3467 domain-containing protein [Spirochaetota bacterium]
MTTHPKRRKTDHEPQPPAQAIPEFYANTVQVNVNPFEVELSAMLVSSKNELKGALNLRLSPQTAAALAKILTEQMAAYEQQFGKIPMPKA